MDDEKALPRLAPPPRIANKPIRRVAADRPRAIISAARDGNLQELTALLDQDASLLQTKHEENSLLHIAAQSSQSYAVVDLLIRRKLPVNGRGWRQYTPLHFAADAGNLSTILLLISNGGDPAAVIDSRDNVLHRLLQSPSLPSQPEEQLIDVVRILLSKVAINERGWLGCTALHHAVGRGNLSIAQLLVDEFGADIEQGDDERNGFLHYSDFNENMGNWLISRAAPISHTNKYGQKAQFVKDNLAGSWPEVLARLEAKRPTVLIHRVTHPGLYQLPWGQFDHLQNLSVTDCDMKSIPIELLEVPNLGHLSVSGNQILELPPWLSQLRSLQSFTAARNRISVIHSLPSSLYHLDLSSNLLSEISSLICDHPTLKSLDLSNNRITRLRKTEARAVRLHQNPLSGIERYLAESRDPLAVWDHFRASVDAPCQPNTCHVVLLGGSKVGKTTVRRCLTEKVSTLSWLFNRYLGTADPMAPVFTAHPLPEQFCPPNLSSEQKVRLIFTDFPADVEVSSLIQRHLHVEHQVILLVVNAVDLRETPLTPAVVRQFQKPVRQWFQQTFRLLSAESSSPMDTRLQATSNVRAVLVVTHFDAVPNSPAIHHSAQMLLSALCKAYPEIGFEPDVCLLNALSPAEAQQTLWPRLGQLAGELTIRSPQRIPRLFVTLPQSLQQFVRSHPWSDGKHPLRCVSMRFFLWLLSLPELGGLSEKQARLSVLGLLRHGHVLQIESPWPIGDTAKDETVCEDIEMTAPRQWIILDPAWFATLVCSVSPPPISPALSDQPRSTKPTPDRPPPTQPNPDRSSASTASLAQQRSISASSTSLPARTSVFVMLRRLQHARGLDIHSEPEATKAIRLLQAIGAVVAEDPRKPFLHQELVVVSRLSVAAPLQSLMKVPPKIPSRDSDDHFEIRAFTIRLFRDTQLSSPDTSSTDSEFPIGFIPQLASRLVPLVIKIDSDASCKLHSDAVDITRVVDDDQRYQLRIQLDSQNRWLDCVSYYEIEEKSSSARRCLAKLIKSIESLTISILSNRPPFSELSSSSSSAPVAQNVDTAPSADSYNSNGRHRLASQGYSQDDDDKSFLPPEDIQSLADKRPVPDKLEVKHADESAGSRPNPVYRSPHAVLELVSDEKFAGWSGDGVSVAKLCPLCFLSNSNTRTLLPMLERGLPVTCSETPKHAVDIPLLFWSVFPDWERTSQRTLPPLSEAEDVPLNRRASPLPTPAKEQQESALPFGMARDRELEDLLFAMAASLALPKSGRAVLHADFSESS